MSDHALNSNKKLIFFLWGGHAQKLKKFISCEHYIYETAHPVAMKADSDPTSFTNTNCFILANQILKLSDDEINWKWYD